MPITPSVLATRKKPIRFDYLGETVSIEYFPAATGGDMIVKAGKLQAEAQAAMEAGDEKAADAILLDIGAWLCSIIASWDYMEDDGETPQPLTPENLAKQVQTFTDFIRAILQAILEDYRQGNATGAASSAR